MQQNAPHHITSSAVLKSYRLNCACCQTNVIFFAIKNIFFCSQATPKCFKNTLSCVKDKQKMHRSAPWYTFQIAYCTKHALQLHQNASKMHRLATKIHHNPSKKSSNQLPLISSNCIKLFRYFRVMFGIILRSLLGSFSVHFGMSLLPGGVKAGLPPKGWFKLKTENFSIFSRFWIPAKFRCKGAPWRPESIFLEKKSHRNSTFRGSEIPKIAENPLFGEFCGFLVILKNFQIFLQITGLYRGAYKPVCIGGYTDLWFKI